MRVLLSFISFCFFLQSYGQDFSVLKKNEKSGDVITTCKFSTNTLHQITFSTHTITVLDYTDIELEEEYHNTDDNFDSTTPISIVVKSNLLDSWYLAFSPSLLLNSYKNNHNFEASFCLPSSPKYIANRALRI